jgi:hypothetical protein
LTFSKFRAYDHYSRAKGGIYRIIEPDSRNMSTKNRSPLYEQARPPREGGRPGINVEYQRTYGMRQCKCGASFEKKNWNQKQCGACRRLKNGLFC